MTVQKYSPEQERELHDGYVDAETDEQRDKIMLDFENKHFKSKKSIVAKLSKMGIYKTKLKVSKITGNEPETKKQLVAKLEKMYGWVGCDGLDNPPDKHTPALNEIYKRSFV